jgi:type IV pilus assembly protein PilW
MNNNNRSGMYVTQSIKQAGVTLVELLIAMVLTLVVVIAASGMYLSSSQAFSSSDVSSQLQDSSRFATYLLRRMIQQAGYEDVSDPTSVGRSQRVIWPAGTATCVRADLCGFNNQIVRVQDVASGGSASGTLPGGFFTDTISIRFQGQSTFSATGERTANADNSIIDCFGAGVPSATTPPPFRAHSMLYVQINPDTNEPELYCSSVDHVTGLGRPATPIVRGVESFQVMYEIGDDTPQARTSPITGATETVRDGVPDRFRWVNAADLAGVTVHNPNAPPNVPAGVYNVPNAVNAWQSVVAVRFGLVLRSELGAAPLPATQLTYFPLGRDLANASDPGTIYVAPQDTRLRRVVTFTVHTRNRTQVFNSNAS